MSTAFARMEARLGVGTLRMLSNASATVLPGSNTIDGIFTKRPVEASLGAAGFLSASTDFVCSIADADAQAVTEGTQLSINSTTYKVALRTDDRQLSQATLDLSLP